jgi:exonuclease VII small subunit
MTLQGQLSQVRELKLRYAKNAAKKKIADELEKELLKLEKINNSYAKQMQIIQRLQEKLRS